MPSAPTPTDPAADVGALSFEDALGELERIVRGLEGGQQRLEDAIGAYERGSALKRHCETKLREAELRVERIVAGADAPSPAPAPAPASPRSAPRITPSSTPSSAPGSAPASAPASATVLDEEIPF